MKTVIIDYAMGNLGSVRRAFEECGAQNVCVADEPEAIKDADRLVLPGVGAFAQGMFHLKEGGWIKPLQEALFERQIPFLGICLGMQLLADWGNEGGKIQGLGVISGEVKKLEPHKPSERIPHVGWNEVVQTKKNKIFGGILDRTDFYFVHSYHFLPKDVDVILGETPYGGGFASAIGKEHVFGIQFHPEKSQKPGFQLIQNFLEF